MKNILKGIGAVLLVLCVGLGKVTKVAERSGNKAAQEMETVVKKASKVVNEATTKMSESPNVQRGVIIGGSRAVQNATRSNAQTTSQPRIVTCFRCYGKGSVQGNDGYVYSCSRCNGTGKIFIK